MCHSNLRPEHLSTTASAIIHPIMMLKAKRRKGVVHRRIQFEAVGDHAENKLDLIRELKIIEQMNSTRYGFDFVGETFTISNSCDQ